jgi:TPR repeat protein
MAFDFKEVSTSEIGKKMRKTLMSSLTGISQFNFRDHVLSRYGSIENLKEKANHGQDWEAQALLSSAYKDGIPELNIEKDLDIAMNLLESSFENGNYYVIDQFQLASLHDLKGSVPHQRRAHELYLKAARLGEIHAELHLAEMYRCGVMGVVDIDLEEAFTWYRRAAGEEPQAYDDQSFLHSTYHIQGNLRNMSIEFKFHALKCLHKYYMSGDCPEGKPQPLKALYYLKKAAELGDPEAQKDLGLCYLTGESGQPKDLDKAKRWLGKASNNGDQEAMKVCTVNKR